MLSRNTRSLLTLSLSAAFCAAPSLQAQSFASAHAGATSKDAATTRRNSDATLPKDFRPFDISVRDGVLTVDGMTAKVHLNYDIKDQPYLYFFMPGSGVAVISLSAVPNSLVERGAVKDNTLTFSADGHQFTLTSANPILEKNGQHDAWVSLDRTSANLSRYPMMGFGTTARGPYHWPGALPESKDATARLAPPLPSSVLPRMISSTSTTVPASE